MSFFGLLGVDFPYCPHCEHPVHADYVPSDFLKEEDCPVESTQYKCRTCGTEMAIESHGGGLFNVYPDEDTFPEDDFF